MNPMLTKAITAIMLALIFYTVGVWWEHRDKRLRLIHLLFFWLGFCMDSIGTGLMTGLANEGRGFLATLHGFTGIIAIVLMLIHAIWATAVLVLKDEKGAVSFHKYSMTVWTIWMVPFVIGVIVGMMR